MFKIRSFYLINFFIFNKFILMMMIDSLTKIFKDVELSWIDSSNDIENSKRYYDLLGVFPNLKSLFKEGKNKDEAEFHRTIKHIFRAFKIFFLLKDGSFLHETLSLNSLQKITKKIKNQNKQNELIIPLILIYHDIGRFFDKKNHPQQSYLLISKYKLLEPYNLLDVEKLLISKIIQYHLLFATIYTGESTFYGVYSLLQDEEFVKLISDKKYCDIFIDFLEIFTFIDILGYSYAKIYDHYIRYFVEINNKLKQILRLLPNRNIALKKALDYSQDWLEWRIAGGLRIFQFIETKPYLSKKFYYNKLRESIKESNIDLIKDLDWNTIKKKYLNHSCRIQIKYGLPVLMLLAFGDFFRSRMKKEQKISHNLLLFWILLSQKIALSSKGREHVSWNVFFIGLPHWSKWDKNNTKLDDDKIKLIIKNATFDFDNKAKEFNLYLNFKQVLISI